MSVGRGQKEGHDFKHWGESREGVEDPELDEMLVGMEKGKTVLIDITVSLMKGLIPGMRWESIKG